MKYGLNNIRIDSKEQLNKYISDEQIMTFYFKEFDLDKFYYSPFREEGKPSFMISYLDGELKWRDFGISNKPSNAVEFVCKLTDTTYFQALNNIYKGVVLNKAIPITKNYIKPDKLTHELLYSDKWLDWQLEYWITGKVSRKTLDHFNVKWCRELWFNNRLFARGSKWNLMYFYNHSVIPFVESWTVYRPNAPFDKKFRKHNILDHIMGYDFLPEKGDLLMITKSYKDIMVLYELGIPAIAPHNENVEIPEEIINELKTRFDKIYVNYDNDETGVKSSIKFTKKYDLKYWNLPLSINCKDPFECSYKYNLDILYKLILDKVERDSTI